LCGGGRGAWLGMFSCLHLDTEIPPSLPRGGKSWIGSLYIRRFDFARFGFGHDGRAPVMCDWHHVVNSASLSGFGTDVL